MKKVLLVSLLIVLMGFNASFSQIDKGYDNFEVSVYARSYEVRQMDDLKWLEPIWDMISNQVHVDKIYLETHRDMVIVDEKTLEKVKKFFNSRGVKTAGGITLTVSEMNRFETYCYSNPEHRRKVKEIIELTARHFDEIILDDFFFTDCKCELCIRDKGEMSWTDFRLKQMTEAAQNLIIGPAKAVNPKVKVVVKYPNWYEAYQETGYNTEIESQLFDEIYTGTETRDTNHSLQHLPRYGSSSLMRWMENIKPGKNGGGWIDPHQGIQNLAYYLEQAYLTYFAKGRELMLFCYSWIVDTIFVPPLGFELEKLDEVLGETDDPVGIPVYEPHHAYGEDHLFDYLGMAGLAFEPQPTFPETKSLIFLTENSARDEQVLEKMKKHMIKGGDVCITSGFLRIMQGKGIEDFTSARHSCKKVSTKDYMISGTGSVFNGEY